MTWPKNNPEYKERVLEQLKKGNGYARSAANAGISRMTLLRWRKEDPEFDEQCHVAEAEGIGLAEDVVISTALQSDDKALAFTAAKFLVERRKPTRDEYAPANPNVPLANLNLNLLAQVAPPIMQLDGQRVNEHPVLEGQVVSDTSEAA